MAYATTEDLERRWRPLTPDERQQADTLLKDAAIVLDTYRSCADEEILAIVSCNMVRRAMNPDAFALGQDGYGSQTWTPYTAAGELVPDWKELKMLKSGSSVGFSKIECL